MVLRQERTSFNYLIQHQGAISAYDLIRDIVNKVVVKKNLLSVHLNPVALEKLMQKHFKLIMPCHSEEIKISVPYHFERTQDGAGLIKIRGKADIFDLPPKNLKKLIQGIIWRKEHFDGVPLIAIARREKCSQDYVGSAIFYSFKTLQAAL